jgi:hypothetical protein
VRCAATNEGSAPAARVEQCFDLARDVIRRLARKRAALDVDHAARGIARPLLAAGDAGGVHGPASEDRVRPRAQRLVELAERRDQRTGLDDGVDAEIVPGAVRGASRHVDLHPHEALVRHHDVEAGRLRHDGRVRADASQHLLDA